MTEERSCSSSMEDNGTDQQTLPLPGLQPCDCLSHNGFLTRAGYMASELAAAQYCNEEVDGWGRLLYLDKVGSVSALVEVEESFVWNDRLLDQQYRRFLNGS